jgi:hypothetical protein
MALFVVGCGESRLQGQIKSALVSGDIHSAQATLDSASIPRQIRNQLQAEIFISMARKEAVNQHFTEAQNDYTTALHLQPDNQDARNGLCVIDHEKALAYPADDKLWTDAKAACGDLPDPYGWIARGLPLERTASLKALQAELQKQEDEKKRQADEDQRQADNTKFLQQIEDGQQVITGLVCGSVAKYYLEEIGFYQQLKASGMSDDRAGVLTWQKASLDASHSEETLIAGEAYNVLTGKAFDPNNPSREDIQEFGQVLASVAQTVAVVGSRGSAFCTNPNG